MSDQSIVTVLGAGASASCGYPLAAELFPRLEDFGNTLGDNRRLVKMAIEHVIAKAREHECLTPDDLAFQIEQRRLGGPDNYRAALRTLFYARIATDLLFLHLEQQVTAESMQRFKGYWHDALGAFSDRWFSGFPATRQRLFSFNYDRIPELALVRFFSAAAGRHSSLDIYAQNVLNTGLSYHDGCQFAEGKFSYLKLHGSIGVEPLGENEIDSQFGHFFRHYSALGSSPDKLTDDFYFKEKPDQDGLPVPKVIPLIAFPADKQRIEGGGRDYNFEKYIKALKPQAEAAFREASEIRVIGYSFAAPDKQWLIDMMRLAPAETEIIVHNPEAARLCKELTVYDHFKNVTPLDDYW